MEVATDVVVTFPDGTTIPARLRSLPPPGAPVNGSMDRLIDYYADLKERAEAGEARAAFTLYQDLTRCKRAYASEASLKEAIQRLRNERVLTYPDSSAPRTLHAGANVAEFEESELRQPYEFCKGIVPEQKRQAEVWLQLATEGGDIWAMQEHALKLGDTEQALEAWQALWQRGYWGALPPLEILANKGLTGSGSDQPDHVRAYAYKLIQFGLLQARYENSASPRSAERIAVMESSLRYAGGYLNPQQTEEAIALAKRLLAENHNCCSGFGSHRMK